MQNLKELVKNIFDSIFWILSKKELYGLLVSHEGSNGQTILDIVRTYKGYGWYKRLSSLQIDSEFIELIDRLSKMESAITIEIGTYMRGTLIGWSRITKDLLISIDIPQGYNHRRQNLYQSLNYPNSNPEIITLQENSQAVSTVDKVRQILQDKQVDILFIDGDHQYEGVKRDFELWSPLVRSGGVIVFHDIVKCDANNYGVHILWEELKSLHRTEEIVADYTRQAFGIGLVYID